MDHSLRPGHNVDHVDVAAGLERLTQLGWSPVPDASTHMLIEFCLMRHARGEEAAAERQAIAQDDPEMRDVAVDFTSWRVILASAIVVGNRKAAERKAAEVSA